MQFRHRWSPRVSLALPSALQSNVKFIILIDDGDADDDVERDCNFLVDEGESDECFTFKWRCCCFYFTWIFYYIFFLLLENWNRDDVLWNIVDLTWMWLNWFIGLTRCWLSNRVENRLTIRNPCWMTQCVNVRLRTVEAHPSQTKWLLVGSITCLKG